MNADNNSVGVLVCVIGGGSDQTQRMELAGAAPWLARYRIVCIDFCPEWGGWIKVTRTSGWTLAFTLSGALWLLMALLTLTGCVPTVTGSAYYDGRYWYYNVKSASDIAGGPRQDVIVVVDQYGKTVEMYSASGIGTLQAVSAGIGAAVISASGQAAAGALQRPSRNTTNVEMNVQGTGGSGGAGGNNTVSGTGGTSSNINTNNAIAP